MPLTRRLFAGSACLAGLLLPVAPSQAQSRAETLRFVTGGSVNSLDPNAPGATRESFGLGMSTYDRLVAFGRKQLDGKWVFDLDNVRGELAESYDVSPDRLKITFHLRPNAVFQDGTPVTAADVKWSLDRAVVSKSLGPAQMLTGSLTSPDQFAVVDDHTVTMTLPKPDRLAIPNLATAYPIIINSKLAKDHATADDPWALAWLKEHTAGSGAYSIESWKPGEQVVLRRNDKWADGSADKPAGFKRVIIQTVPEPSTRANLVERGDADIAVDLQAADVAAIEKGGKLKVVSVPQFNAVTLISFNNKLPPFDNVDVRKAIAFALPYDAMFKTALFDRGRPLFDAKWGDNGAPSGSFPVAQPVHTDLALAKKYLAEAGMPNGFSTTFTYNVGQSAIGDPMAALIKESLAKIGINIDVQKMSDAQMSTMISEKRLPFFTESVMAWLPMTDYFYRNFYTGNQRWNYSSTDDADIKQVAQDARFELNPAKYEQDARKLNTIAFDHMPQVPVWQANQDAVMAKSVDGFTYEFHRQVDFRDLKRD